MRLLFYTDELLSCMDDCRGSVKLSDVVARLCWRKTTLHPLPILPWATGCNSCL